MKKSLRKRVKERAQYLCEYCLSPEPKNLVGVCWATSCLAPYINLISHFFFKISPRLSKI